MLEENIKRTEISSLGEFGLIDHLTKDIKLINESTLKGVGDDAAVIDYGNKKILLSTDLLVEGVHFDLTYTPLRHLGYKAAVVNFSDIAAMNGLPKQILVGISLSNRFSVEAIEEIYSGILLACNKYKVDLAGGDTTSSKSGLFISITVIGEAEEKDITYRKGAQEYDLICVTGDLGGAYTGLQILEREKAEFKANPNMQPQLEGFDYILERQLKPEARTDMVEMFKKLSLKPTAMIDISDGLASEIIHICKQSEVGCTLYEDKIPIDQVTYNAAMDFNLDPTTCALNGGEDYELLFTIKQADFDKVKNNPDITVIGNITHKDAGYNLVSKSGTQHPITAQGWDALLKKDLEK
jgi:thiamine-monophosphate kinase